MSYVQYGCGHCAPSAWMNFDASPRLRLQRLPVIARAFQRGPTVFPRNMRYGDIVKGLPVPDDSADAVYASHVLEHLTLEEFRAALRNTLRMLKSGGTFRLLVPDLASVVRFYLARVERGDPESCHWLMRVTDLGWEVRPRGPKSRLIAALGNGRHCWMWDAKSLSTELDRSALLAFVNVNSGIPRTRCSTWWRTSSGLMGAVRWKRENISRLCTSAFLGRSHGPGGANASVA
jgi:SAM-dependent methyltransferase